MSHTQSPEDPATTTLDLYALLDLPNPAANPAVPPPDLPAIRRAYRKASLLHHPDKAPAAERALHAQKFHELSIAVDILGDESKRAVYDARQAREHSERRERAAYSMKRARMMQELERREGGGAGFREEGGAAGFREGEWAPRPKAGNKRTHSAAVSEEREAEIARLGAEGARKRVEFEERRRRRRGGAEKPGKAEGAPGQRVDGGGAGGMGEQVDGDLGGERWGTGTPRFSFSREKGEGGKGVVGGSTSAPGGKLFESTMAKLKEAQRRKEAARGGKVGAEDDSVDATNA